MKAAVKRYLLLAMGSLIVSFGLAAFLVPHKIVAGGTTGLATILYHITGFPIGLLVLALDIPLLLWAIHEMGWRLGANTLFSTGLIAIFLQLFSTYFPDPLTPDPLLSTLYGGGLCGLGLGLTFRLRGTTGGTDLLAAIINHRSGLGLGSSLFIVDGIVIALSGLIFDFSLLLYGLIAIFLSSQAIDWVQSGLSRAKVVFIISTAPERLREKILDDLGRGVTLLYGEGGYNRVSRPILLAVVGQGEISALKSLVHREDDRAFVIVSPAAEVLGEGFKLSQSDFVTKK